jgi:nicotinate-nucleotide adenylyltransferase
VRLGVFGGTFDPVHIGHLAAAVDVRHALHLDRVLLVVANQPWQKVGTRAISDAEDRYAMAAAAVAEYDGIEASRLEIDRGGPSYTVETLEALAADGHELFLVVGSDVVDDLDTWERAGDVRRLATVVPVPRTLAVSSSDLRRRVADGRPLDVLVPAPALRVIRERGLYAERSDEHPGGGHERDGVRRAR